MIDSLLTNKTIAYDILVFMSSLKNETSHKSTGITWFSKFFFVMYVLIFIVGLVGNFIVIYFVLFYKRMQTMTNKFITNLAVADLLVIFICVPVTSSRYIYNDWIFGALVCRFSAFVQGVSLSVSVLTLTAISIDRYYIIYKPMKARSICTNRKVKIIVIAIWLISVFIMSPLLFIFEYQHIPAISHINSEAISMCVEVWPSFELKLAFEMFLIFSIFILPILFMSYAYYTVSKTLWLAEHNENNKTIAVKFNNKPSMSGNEPNGRGSSPGADSDSSANKKGNGNYPIAQINEMNHVNYYNGNVYNNNSSSKKNLSSNHYSFGKGDNNMERAQAQYMEGKLNKVGRMRQSLSSLSLSKRMDQSMESDAVVVTANGSFVLPEKDLFVFEENINDYQDDDLAYSLLDASSLNAYLNELEKTKNEPKVENGLKESNNERSKNEVKQTKEKRREKTKPPKQNPPRVNNSKGANLNRTPSLTKSDRKFSKSIALNSLINQLHMYRTRSVREQRAGRPMNTKNNKIVTRGSYPNSSKLNYNAQNNQIAINKLITSRRRVVKLLIVLVIVFLISWLPYHIIGFGIDLIFYWERRLNAGGAAADHSGEKASSFLSTNLFPFALCLALANSATNPVCYIALSHGFRSMFKSTCKKFTIKTGFH